MHQTEEKQIDQLQCDSEIQNTNCPQQDPKRTTGRRRNANDTSVIKLPQFTHIPEDVLSVLNAKYIDINLSRNKNAIANCIRIAEGKYKKNYKHKQYAIIYDKLGMAQVPCFDEIQVSTMTVIAHTNLVINTDKFFKYMPIVDYELISKRRGRKRRNTNDDSNQYVPPGSIISLKKKRLFRGAVLKPNKLKSKTFFRHSVSVVMLLEDQKMINVKVSCNGKLQMTGCKSVKHAVEFTKYLYSLMIEAEEWTGETIFAYKDTSLELSEDTKDALDKDDNTIELDKSTQEQFQGLEAIYRVVMCNRDFSIGYKIRRDLLNAYINKDTEFRSIFESSIGTSVNIKLKSHNRFDRELQRLKITAEGECVEDKLSYAEFFNMLSPKEKKSEVFKQAYHTFLVFASGSIIMSSAGAEMSLTFYKLINLLVQNRKKIEEKEGVENFDSSWLNNPTERAIEA